MKTAILTINEIKEGNPRFCLSAKRALNQCSKCDKYERCESKKVNLEYEKLIKQKSKVHSKYMETIREINNKIEET